MDAFKDHELVINWKLFKRCLYYHIIFDTKLSKINEWNRYQKTFVTCIVTFIILLFFGTMGLFVDLDSSFTDTEKFIIFYANSHAYLMLVKLCVLLYYSDKFWEIFDVSQFKFLKSAECIKNIKILYKHRDDTIVKTNIYVICSFSLIVQWIFLPFVVEMFLPSNTETQRRQNIINFTFPVRRHTYNNFYVLFYLFEVFMCSFFMYCVVIIDVIVLSLGWVITAQYRVIITAFLDIGHGFDSEKYDFNKYYEQFKSIVLDIIQLDRKMKTFHSIVKPIVLVHVSAVSLLVIILTFVSITAFRTLNLVSLISFVKLSVTVIFMIFQLAFYCYLFDTLNTERESVSFGMYSCNWTVMDFKFKQLLLLAMRMNDANRLIMKFSPKKRIDKQLFARVLTTACNTVSIMLKVLSNKDQEIA